MSNTVPISQRAAAQRINRALSKESKQLRAARGERVRQDFGDYYVVDLARNVVVAKDCDLEEIGRKLGAIKPFERIED